MKYEIKKKDSGSRMECLKSFLVEQVYTYSSKEETEVNIECISKVFEQIYLLIKDLKRIDEDSVLIYHCNAFVKGYQYSGLDDIKANLLEVEDKVQWIKDFIRELHSSFSNLKDMEQSKVPYLEDLRKLKIPAFVYPFILKGYKYLQKEELNDLYHILEIVVFRYRLVNSRVDINSRIEEVLLNFNGDLKGLAKHFKEKLNVSWYWANHRVEEYLNGYMYDSPVLKYLLWKYEESLQMKGYKIGKLTIENEQIEHISPQTPTNGEGLASGYSVDENNEYSPEFIEKYLNCLGNLMLISGSHNASIGNKPFEEKLASYQNNPLLKQQMEIIEFVNEDAPNFWGIEQITLRHWDIVNGFAIKKWNFDSVL